MGAEGVTGKRADWAAGHAAILVHHLADRVRVVGGAAVLCGRRATYHQDGVQGLEKGLARQDLHYPYCGAASY